jgi:hypothetical protein
VAGKKTTPTPTRRRCDLSNETSKDGLQTAYRGCTKPAGHDDDCRPGGWSLIQREAVKPVETKHGVELATDDAGTHINGASCAVCGSLLWVGDVLWVTALGLSHQSCEEGA